MDSKDYFSAQAREYARYRPLYPEALYSFILSKIQERHFAWDCATGNGQVAVVLSNNFKNVEATDISQAQLSQAVKRPNINYTQIPAENTPFESNHFDLITVAQALHWLDCKKFYQEVRRTAKHNALVAVWGYGLLTIEVRIDQLLKAFYQQIVGPHWPPERKHIENEYRNLPFPFESKEEMRFSSDYYWTPEHFQGYLMTWSAVQRFIKLRGYNPVPEFIEKLKSFWPEKVQKPVNFPVFLQCGRVLK